MKILIVDDVFLIRKYIENTLKNYKYTSIYEAENGLEAIQVVEIEKPQIIFMDMNMPIMNGLEAIPYLRQILPDTFIVSMSSADNLSALVDTLSLGADRYITKPLSYYQIAEILEFSTFKV